MTSYTDYLARLKELRALMKTEKKDSFLRIRLAGEYLIFPYDTGLQVLAALNQAERTNAPYAYSQPPTIDRLQSDQVEITVLSRKEYEDIHMAQLMQLKLDEIRNLRSSEGKEPPF